MYEATKEELQELHDKWLYSIRYTMAHHDELTSREHSHVLYGPYTPGLGASIPCNTLTPKSTRRLMHKTRRKDCVIYHLDENYKVLRTLLVLDHKVRNTFHHFELDGTVYAYDYSQRLYPEIHFLRYVDDKPVNYGVITEGMLFVQFYEYVDDQKMLVTTYSHWAEGKLGLTVYGCIPDPDAPIGAPNSYVHRVFEEETAEDVDFSRWFQ